jgi:hypothetical protein
MRSFNLLLTSLAMSLSVQTASAQRATIAVTARVLPSATAMAAGTIAPRVESGNTIAASAQLSSVASIPAITSASSAASFVEFTLGVAVSANVHYEVAVSSNGDQLKVRKGSANGRQEISYRVPNTVGSRPPAAVTVTLTAASIS